jgi:hypothetical protein
MYKDKGVKKNVKNILLSMCNVKEFLTFTFTEYGTVLTTILPILFLYLNTVIVTAGDFERNGSGRFGALKSNSTHHFFRNACTKSGSLRFSQFSGFFVCLYNYEF